ncbi:hypothetical protein [uncultured Muriicola sp.]|uniref:hypothetical protein n=1 Tax=uncultured Muriicola sp. TaxID=1583102 RepID=UPI0026303052|nr:hypothetical protein [uncultured Muriicola sp.]
MPYTIEHRVLPEYLEVHIEATIVPGKEAQEAIERWFKIAELCKIEKRNLILAFMDLQGQHTTDSKFKLVDTASTLGWLPNYKLSMVVKNEKQQHHLSFTETAMNTLGFEMKIFKNKRDAKKWLFTE